MGVVFIRIYEVSGFIVLCLEREVKVSFTKKEENRIVFDIVTFVQIVLPFYLSHLSLF